MTHLKEAIFAAAVLAASTFSVTASAADVIKVMDNGVQVASVNVDEGKIEVTQQQNLLAEQTLGM